MHRSMNDEPETGGGSSKTQPISGTLKWFSQPRGFGFVVSPEFEQDVLLHQNVLGPLHGQALLEGLELIFFYDMSENGPRVTEIVSAKQPDGAQIYVLDEEIAALELLPARVKWFNEVKGFGFANVYGDPADVFLHASLVHQFGRWNLAPGDAIAIRVQDSERGKTAVDIRPWDDATRED